MSLTTKVITTDSLEGIDVTIDAGIFGKFHFFGGFSESYEGEEGWNGGVLSRSGESTHITRNGEFFLPWHIAASLTDNGNPDNWISQNHESVIIQHLLYLRQLYLGENWYDAVQAANRIAKTCVY